MKSNNTPRVLILEDESSLRTALFRAFDRNGYKPLTSSRIDEAKKLLQMDDSIDLAIVDMNLPDGNGIDYMCEIKAQSPDCEVIILTGAATVESAISATQKGAFHFVTKPFNLDEVLSLADKAIKHKKLKFENTHLRTELNKKYKFDQIIGDSNQIQSVLKIVERVADTDSTILITGESGTGKELVARAIHYNSGRTSAPFIPINCGAIPSELLESELFGHVKGAFTGAINNRIGRFEMADGGTIFLDEIGDLEMALQVKILRALQERSFEPVGSTKTVSVNVRVIAATNLNLESAVEQGKFREDLYYRLNVIPIAIPALRDRRSDIPLLLKHFMTHFNKTKGSSLVDFSAEALSNLKCYRWPGNIRELENLVERLSILKGRGIVELIDLPLKYKGNSEPLEAESTDLNNVGTLSSNSMLSGMAAQLPDLNIDFNTAVDSFENALILRALEKTGWNRNQAAMLLKLNRTTLVEKIKKKGLKPPENFEFMNDASEGSTGYPEATI